ncbi:MAG TPA: BON domain-containing protein [Gemmatimonadales bacterium]|nr:BON domain-containing protein [Gemmatimonadales bacterium]
MRHDDDRLNAGEALLWAALGTGAGLLAGITLSAWVGGVSPGRVRRAANRLREATAPQLTIGASVQAVRVALQAEPRLGGLGIQAVPVSRGVVELRGWVPSRLARTVAGRTALAVPGIESVINSILVRGEDDQALSEEPRANDQTA